MSSVKDFLKRKDIVITPQRYLIEALGAMAQGLFASLLIGTIIKTLGQQTGLEVLVDLGGYASAMSGPAMACAMGVPAPVIRHTLQSFSGVEHRIEKVRVFQGVTYINDSKGTNVDSTIKAVQSMKAPTVLLLGGYDKHTDFMPLCREIIASGRIDDVVVMGETARQIREQLEEAGYDRITQAYSLRDAVDKARALAVSGGNVLLSPACASFDMFRDYEHRGAVFKEIVNALN